METEWKYWWSLGVFGPLGEIFKSDERNTFGPLGEIFKSDVRNIIGPLGERWKIPNTQAVNWVKQATWKNTKSVGQAAQWDTNTLSSGKSSKHFEKM